MNLYRLLYNSAKFKSYISCFLKYLKRGTWTWLLCMATKELFANYKMFRLKYFTWWKSSTKLSSQRANFLILISNLLFFQPVWYFIYFIKRICKQRNSRLLLRPFSSYLPATHLFKIIRNISGREWQLLLNDDPKYEIKK